VLLPSQMLYPGKLAEAWRRERDNLAASHAVDRLWAKDATLWRGPEGQKQLVGGNLAWLDLPDQIGPYMPRVGELVAATKRDGFQDVVLIAMGDSDLAAETLLHTAAAKRYRRFFLLDSVDPVAIQAVEEQLDFAVTLFVVASKSGKRIETHALLLYFLNQLKVKGVGDPGRCFIAVTEEDSYLAELAKNYGFLGNFFDSRGIKGRYSSLIHFGLLLSAIWSSEPAAFVSSPVAMRDLCRQPATGDKNPALGLAALLAASATEGRDKLFLTATQSLRAFTYRIGQLVGTSIAKQGQGLIPVADELPEWSENYRNGCTAAVLTMRGDQDAEVKAFEMQLRTAGVPTVSIELNSPEELGAEMFKWEIATALACAPLNVNPFDEPDVQDGRAKVSSMLEVFAAKRGWPARTARIRERGIELYAEGETRLQISTLNLSEALRTFFEAKEADGYLAMIAFAGGSSATNAALGQLREQLASRLGIPILLSFGPRYLRNFEQVYKGGPSTGLFMILTAEPAEDIDIPGAGYTFGQLQLALALSDFQSLVSRRLMAIHMHFTQGLESGLAEAEQLVRKL
jgi:transaldolase / glucose-6-phosphate isomerase